MGQGLEVYTDNDVIQVGKELDVSYIADFKSVSEVQGSSTPNPSYWKGLGKMLQTDGADMYAIKSKWYDDIPELRNYSSNSRWCRMLWRSAPYENIPSVNFGFEMYDAAGNIEFNSSVRPLRILDSFSGYWDIYGSSGTNLSLIDKSYDVPIMVLFDIVPRLRAIPRIIASSAGRFKVTATKTNDSYGNGQYAPSSEIYNGWRYSFVVIDASGY